MTKDKILILIDELQVQKESLKRLNRTQSDLSSHAKMFTTEIKPVLLNKIIDEETEEEKYSKRGKNFNFTKSLDPAIKEVEIDEMQMRTILRNLIENAIDALSEKKKGTIDIKSEQSGDQVIIEITDNGMGIPKNWYDKVKEPFFTTKRKGTGIGLSIVKSFLDEINGSFDISSDGKSWATITMRFPVKNIS